MKSIIATILLLLIVSQTQAAGFYQQLIGNAPQSMTGDNSTPAKFSYSPLYLQVMSHNEHFAVENGAWVRGFSYTPLYLQVTGKHTRKAREIAKQSVPAPEPQI